ncbi:UNVERIFIED_ORG: AraC family transcriptional regulator [Rhizobium esperanzae]|nr:AraC family transcriptional regulator protein [Rhizobium sp. N731]ANL19728.1 AraC family transcriptional regulator protein [Rhizobium sp. N1314]
MNDSRLSVFRFLSASPTARMSQSIDLGFGRSAAIWSNAHDRMSYQRPDGHTFSLYLSGGAGTRRLDGGPDARGRPGVLCIMPQGHSSEWEITDFFEFVHLYIPDDQMRRMFAETFDRDARLMALPEVTFDDAPALALRLRQMTEAMLAGGHLLAEEAMTQAIHDLFVDPRYGGMRACTISGGLAPHVRRRTLDYIEAHLGETIRLQDLAEIGQLSAFHFQRMFRASFGVSPHGWVAHRRVERAKSMLSDMEPIAQIASACGFSSQSHMTRAFKQGTGLTPSAYRQRQ